MILKNSFLTVAASLIVASSFLVNQNSEAVEERSVIEEHNKIDFIQYKFDWETDPIARKKSYWGVVKINSFNGEIISTSTEIKILDYTEWLSIKAQNNNTVTLKSNFLKNDFKAKKALFERRVLYNGNSIHFDASEYDFNYINKPLVTDKQRLEIAKIVKSTLNKELKKNSSEAYVVLNGEFEVNGKKISSKMVWFLIEA